LREFRSSKPWTGEGTAETKRQGERGGEKRAIGGNQVAEGGVRVGSQKSSVMKQSKASGGETRGGKVGGPVRKKSPQQLKKENSQKRILKTRDKTSGSQDKARKIR